MGNQFWFPRTFTFDVESVAFIFGVTDHKELTNFTAVFSIEFFDCRNHVRLGETLSVYVGTTRPVLNELERRRVVDFTGNPNDLVCLEPIQT